jgi:hypothetical protein
LVVKEKKKLSESVSRETFQNVLHPETFSEESSPQPLSEMSSPEDENYPEEGSYSDEILEERKCTREEEKKLIDWTIKEIKMEKGRLKALTCTHIFQNLCIFWDFDQPPDFFGGLSYLYQEESNPHATFDGKGGFNIQINPSPIFCVECSNYARALVELSRRLTCSFSVCQRARELPIRI